MDLTLSTLIQSGRAMSYYWAFTENVSPQVLRRLSERSMEDKYGLFWDKGMAASINQTCEEWADLLVAIMSISVEPNRLDLQAALTRA